MKFDLFWIDIWPGDKLFGFGLFTIERDESSRSLFSIYWADRELLVELLWFRILSSFILLFYRDDGIKRGPINEKAK